MRKFILSSLAMLMLASADGAVAAVGESSRGANVHADGVSTMLGGKVSNVQLSDAQSFFNSSSLGSARVTQAAVSSSPDFEPSGSLVGDFLPVEGRSSGAILLAGALVVVALVLRRLS